jgi:DNA-binding transcriptional LysR family regulator
MAGIIAAFMHIEKCFNVGSEFRFDMKITHRQIEVFRAVMVAGHVTRAAEALHTSQPTVSRELARLEQVLGIDLFERVRGRLRPTVRAMALLEEVELSYVGLDRITATALSLRDFSLGRLQVTCLPALAQALLPDAIARFVRDQPQAGVSISPLESPALEVALTEQRFDLGLTERREPLAATQLHTLLEVDEVCVLPAGHALAAKSLLQPTDFAGEAFVSLAPTDPYRQQIDEMFSRAGVQRHMQIESPSAVSVCALVRQGVGVAIVNPLTALELCGPGLEMRPISVSIPFHVAVVLPQWRSEHPLRTRLLDALSGAAASLQDRLQHGKPRIRA